MDYLNALSIIINFILLPGLTYGSQLALGAMGVTLIYAVLRFSNFAHGEIMSFGTMICILFTWLGQSYGLSLGFLPTALLFVPVAIVFTILYCLVLEKSVFSYYRAKKSNPIIFLIASIGVMFFTAGLIRLIIGPSDQSFNDGVRFIFTVREFKSATGLNEGFGLKTSQAITILTTIILCSLLFFFLSKTRTGKSMRAFSDNEDLALLSGIDPNKVVLLTWIITGGLATFAGVLYGLDKIYKPFIFLQMLLPIFSAAIVGGVGNPVGAFFGGYIIALSELFVTFAYKKVLGYMLPENLEPSSMMQFLATDYKFSVSFIILVIVLIIKPTGLFSGKTI